MAQPGDADAEIIEEVVIDDAPPAQDTAARAVPAWILSFVVHAVILGLFTLIVYAQRIEDPPAVRTAALPPPQKIDEVKPKPVDQPQNPIPLDVPDERITEETTPLHALDVPVETFSSEDEVEADVPRGREEATAASELGGEQGMMAIGPGGGAAGMFGQRTGGGKQRSLGIYGGSHGSERGVDRALMWFKRHQSPNGQWDIDGYPVNCTDAGPKCEPGQANTGEAGDVAGTGYALLCYLGAGYDHRMPSRFRTTVRKGIDWLVSIQKQDGLWGSRNYEHSIATMAIAEAYAMTNDPVLKEPAQKAVDIILDRQIAGGDGYGLGWDYVKSADRNDASVSGWAVMALKSAAAANLDVERGMAGAKRYLEGAWKAANKDFRPADPYKDTTTFPYTWNQKTGEVKVEPGSLKGHDMAPVGALLAVFLGHTGDDVMLNSLANHIMAHQLPRAYPCNTYYMYYNTLAIFQVGGERWKTWNGSVRDLLVTAQRTGNDCFDGSWDWEGTLFHGSNTGRILSTAYCCLSLEVYYRYRPVAEATHAEATPAKADGRRRVAAQ